MIPILPPVFLGRLSLFSLNILLAWPAAELASLTQPAAHARNTLSLSLPPYIYICMNVYGSLVPVSCLNLDRWCS